jgi:hypothetical protein
MGGAANLGREERARTSGGAGQPGSKETALALQTRCSNEHGISIERWHVVVGGRRLGGLLFIAREYPGWVCERHDL